eukprot:c21301_g2_i1 orf=651-917(-)
MNRLNRKRRVKDNNAYIYHETIPSHNPLSVAKQRMDNKFTTKKFQGKQSSIMDVSLVVKHMKYVQRPSTNHLNLTHHKRRFYYGKQHL